MRPLVRPLLVVVLLGFVPLPAWSVIVEMKDGKTYRGHLVEQNVLRVTVRVEDRKEPLVLDRRDILRVTQIVREDRLKELKPESPELYFTYAEELSSQREDPEARDTALRLYLIAAHLDAKKFGYKSFIRMARLGRTTNEKRTFTAMAFLLDMLRDEKTLKGATVSDHNVQARENFIKALEMLRRGKTTQALAYVQKDGVNRFFDLVPGLMSYNDFIAMCEKYPECTKCRQGRNTCPRCKGGSGALTCATCGAKGWVVCEACNGKPRRVPLSYGQVELILKLEILNAGDPKARLEVSGAGEEVTWSRLLSPTQMKPVPVLSLKHMTEFDPRKNIYVDGQWQAPK
jgi:hypothetical protein